MEFKFRALTAEEIEVRVGSITDGGLSLLLYMDARAAALLLDETVGPMNWRCSYKDINGKMYCNVDIWDDDKKEWVYKENVGTETNTEAEKGEASDGLKRAVATWGVRELYTAPFIWIDKSKLKHHEKKTFNGRDSYKSNDKFRVSSITVAIQGYSRVITNIEITNESTKAVCFNWSLAQSKKPASNTNTATVTVSMKATPEQIEALSSVYKGEKLEQLKAVNDITDLSELSYTKATELCNKLAEMAAAKKNAS